MSALMLPNLVTLRKGKLHRKLGKYCTTGPLYWQNDVFLDIIMLTARLTSESEVERMHASVLSVGCCFNYIIINIIICI